ATNNRWAARKGGSFVARDALSFEQQQILAAVPRWKKEWVRPSNLQPGQNPNYKILKWVIDTSADKSSGTAEEMEAAVEQVTAGKVPNVDGTVSSANPAEAQASAPQPGSNSSTPAPTSTPATLPTQVPTTTLANSSNPLKEVMQTDSAQMVGGEQTVQEAVQPLKAVSSEGLVGAGGATEQKDKSLMEE
ncbi:hypothetical protein JCM5350_000001, partial [Sporobolomyces pararoseus]